MEEHKKLYEEALVKEIMLSTALYVQEVLQEEGEMEEEQLCSWIEQNYHLIIEETLSGEEDDDTSTL